MHKKTPSPKRGEGVRGKGFSCSPSPGVLLQFLSRRPHPSRLSMTVKYSVWSNRLSGLSFSIYAGSMISFTASFGRIGVATLGVSTYVLHLLPGTANSLSVWFPKAIWR